MKNIIPSTYANLYLNAADKLGLQYRIEDETESIACIYNQYKEIRFKSSNLPLNSRKSRARTIDKETTSTLLQQANIPVPDFAVFSDPTKALLYAQDKVASQISIVIKPIRGSNAVGITINPTTKRQVEKAVEKAFSRMDKIIIEEYIVGHHYRITVMDKEIIAVTQRIPAYVIGDEVHSIQQLIDLKNIQRASMKLPLIRFRLRDLDYIKSADIDLDAIPPKGKHVRLQNGCDYLVGGERVRIDIASIPAVNQKVFTSAVKALRLRFGGIDYISPDITQPYTEVQSAINEINNSPHQDVHHYDSYPHDNYAATRIIEKIFDLNC